LNPTRGEAVAERALQDDGAGGGSGNGAGRAPDFRGIATLTLDAKGRLAVPTRHREALGNGRGRVVITADPSRCLLVYPLDAWEPIQARLMALSSFDERIRALQRLIVGHADDVDIDAQGRVLVPPPLRDYASLARDVVLVGQGRRFELWDAAAWAAQTARAIAFDAGGLPPELAGFSL
jgi:MraZ protein